MSFHAWWMKKNRRPFGLSRPTGRRFLYISNCVLTVTYQLTYRIDGLCQYLHELLADPFCVRWGDRLAQFVTGHPINLHCNSARLGVEIMPNASNERRLVQCVVFALGFSHSVCVVAFPRCRARIESTTLK